MDDGSTDNSIQLLRVQKFGDYDIKVIRLSKNFGAHAAVRAGIKHASGDYITFLPADLQDPLDLIDRSLGIVKKRMQISYLLSENYQQFIFERAFSEFYAYLLKSLVDPKFPGKGLICFFSIEK